MKPFYFKLGVLLLFITHFTTVYGQGRIYVHTVDGNQQKFLLSDIDKLTFPGDNMLVTFKKTSLKNYPIPEIRYCNFKFVSDWNINHMNYVIRIFPNPIINNFRIESSLEISKIIIYDVIGQKLEEIIADSNVIQLQLNNYSRGVYLLQMMTEEGIFSEKIIKD